MLGQTPHFVFRVALICIYFLGSVGGSGAMSLCIARDHIALETSDCCGALPHSMTPQARACDSCTDVAVGVSAPAHRDRTDGATDRFLPAVIVGLLAPPSARGCSFGRPRAWSHVLPDPALPSLRTVVLLV